MHQALIGVFSLFYTWENQGSESCHVLILVTHGESGFKHRSFLLKSLCCCCCFPLNLTKLMLMNYAADEETEAQSSAVTSLRNWWHFLIQQVLSEDSMCAGHSGMKVWLHLSERGKSNIGGVYLKLFSHGFHFVLTLHSLGGIISVNCSGHKSFQVPCCGTQEALSTVTGPQHKSPASSIVRLPLPPPTPKPPCQSNEATWKVPNGSCLCASVPFTWSALHPLSSQWAPILIF